MITAVPPSVFRKFICESYTAPFKYTHRPFSLTHTLCFCVCYFSSAQLWNLAPGWSSLCDLSELTRGNYKSLCDWTEGQGIAFLPGLLSWLIHHSLLGKVPVQSSGFMGLTRSRSDPKSNSISSNSSPQFCYRTYMSRNQQKVYAEMMSSEKVTLLCWST